MNKDEKIALQYLESLGFENIVHEPDGNIPPDFLINNKIGIEVRRLNQNYMSGNRNNGLEEIQFPLLHKIENLLSEIKSDSYEKSYFISYTFRRPISLSGTVNEMKRLLTEFAETGSIREGVHVIHNRFKFAIIPASEKHEQLFVLGGYSDHDSGGFVVSEVNRNLEICANEKSEKIKDLKWKYPEWWLVLVDYIGYGLSAAGLSQLKEIQTKEYSWDRIILVNPLNPQNGVEI
ncbi:MAG TPA: hypothetical protein PLH00_04100 [Bacteroidaceae bacterium]|nr:hypothetical protein [Bacteroidaceae bacterium]